MKKWHTRLSGSLAIILFLVAGCMMRNPLSDNAMKAGGALPSDTISDTARIYGADFAFETIHSVELDLAVELYEADRLVGGGQLQKVPSNAASVVATILNSSGYDVFRGQVDDNGRLRAAFRVASAPENMTLRLTAQGFETRSVVIRNLQRYSEIRRTMGMVRSGVGAQNTTLVDSDGDGVPDGLDAFPMDPDRAFINRLPAEGQLSIAFEDLYLRAQAGDADYNDFVAHFYVEEILNAENQIVEIRGQATAAVKLAGYDHDFGIFIGFPGVSASLDVHYYNSSGGLIDEVAGRRERDHSNIVLFRETSRSLGRVSSFILTFDEPQEPSAVDEPPYDPYLYVRNTGYDIHLIGKEPLPGSQNPAGSTFQDAEGFPWALLVPVDWIHPEEAQRIEIPYPRFTQWRESFGEEHGDWYLHRYSPYVPPREVYVSGRANVGGRTIAVYWLDDETEVTRVDLHPESAGVATGVAADSTGTVFASGWVTSGGIQTAVYWDDGELTILDNGNATGIQLSDSGSVYLSGCYHDGATSTAVYWVDDGASVTRHDLHPESASCATGIAVDGSGVVYASGWYNDGTRVVAAYWRDSGGSVTRFDLYPGTLSQANAIVVDGATVHIAGYHLDGLILAAEWTDDDSGLQPLNTQVSDAKAVTRFNGETYTAGDYLDTLDTEFVRRAVYWRETTQTELADGASTEDTFADGIAIVDGDVYVAGRVGDGSAARAVYWQNGKRVALSSDAESQAYSLFVR